MERVKRPISPGVPSRTRDLTIVAQDPGVTTAGGGILTATIAVPAEELAPGPRGYRVHVVDYDASTRTLYQPARLPADRDPYRGINAPEKLLGAPDFHAQNVYALIMSTLARFEYVLGRRVAWGFDGHQLTVAPHAFADANAFYSERDQSLLFGYFPGRDGRPIFTCLSHDVVVHEATHAILDGVRERFTDVCSPDQAAFHEAFADVVALLSVFALPDVVGCMLNQAAGPNRPGSDLIDAADVTPDRLRQSVLLGLADQMGEEIARIRGQALRRSASIEPSREWLSDPRYEEPHLRGEILVAPIMRAFVDVWVKELAELRRVEGNQLKRQRVVNVGAEVADYLLTMCIRALDYTPPVHIEFADFLSAMLTADHEIRPDERKYRFRAALRESFAGFGITPASKGSSEPGLWLPFEQPIARSRNRFEPLTRDPDEVFRFVWENRRALGLREEAYTRVISVRPCMRVAPDDGFILRETVAEVLQQMSVPAADLKALGIEKPAGMAADHEVNLIGGLTLVFDEFCQLKLSIHKRLCDPRDPRLCERQSNRLRYLSERGQFSKGKTLRGRLSSVHRARAMGRSYLSKEVW